MADLNVVDIVILAIFFLSALIGLARGLVSEIVSLITLIAAFIIAIVFAHPLALAFTSSPSVQHIVSQTSSTIGVNAAQPVSYLAIGLSFGLLFAGTAIIGAIIKAVLNVAFQTGVLGIGNRLLGAIFGLVRGYIINLVLIFLVQLSPMSNEPWWQQSTLTASFQPEVAWLASVVSPTLTDLKSKFGDTMQNMGSRIQNMTR